MANETSPQVYARIGGALYLLIIAAGIWTELFVGGSMIVSGDAAATARNILAAPSLWRAGIAANLVMHLSEIGVMIALYVLLRPVSRNLALLFVLFNLVQTAVLVAAKLVLVIPLLLLGDAPYLKAFGLVFFGFVCLVQGHLIRRSGYLPRVLGVLLQIAGLCYLLNSFTLILAPRISSKLFMVIMLPVIIAELSLALWLLVKGVDVEKWRARALAQRAWV